MILGRPKGCPPLVFVEGTSPKIQTLECVFLFLPMNSKHILPILGTYPRSKIQCPHATKLFLALRILTRLNTPLLSPAIRWVQNAQRLGSRGEANFAAFPNHFHLLQV